MIEIVAYDPDWPEEFESIAELLHAALGEQMIAVDHIGSTAVPGLAAKDRIDIQLRVRGFDPAVKDRLLGLGYQFHEGLRDHAPVTFEGDAAEWEKWVFSSSPAQRATNIHVRMATHANARYALLFRDYLRAHPIGREAYAVIKQELAARHPDDTDFYYAIKDPLFDIIWEAAEEWAAVTRWEPIEAGDYAGQ